MKRIIISLISLLSFAVPVNAELFVRGTDSLGNQLIYDDDLNITWYDYTEPYSNWQTQMNWASGLSVSGGDFEGVYDDWRLPTTVDGPYEWGYDGTTTAGYNITSSEMGHLYYIELENVGVFDEFGNETSCYPGDCLTNTGVFQNLNGNSYWSSTRHLDTPDSSKIWRLDTHFGSQYFDNETTNNYAIAVRTGDVSSTVVPEPISSTLFIIGGGALGIRRFIKRKPD